MTRARNPRTGRYVKHSRHPHRPVLRSSHTPVRREVDVEARDLIPSNQHRRGVKEDYDAMITKEFFKQKLPKEEKLLKKILQTVDLTREEGLYTKFFKRKDERTV